jgi:CheY-like chemotaxis protein
MHMNAGAWTVCVIEPNKFERQIIVDLLRAAGVTRFKAFADAASGLEYLVQVEANVVISAFELTPTDGAAWTRSFRRDRKVLNRKAAIFITSGAFSRSMAEQCRHAGANALIGKPLSAKVLIATIGKVLANPRAFVEADGYVGPCRRAGIVTAGAPKKRRKADDAAAASAGETQTLAHIVGALSAASIAFLADSAKGDACEAALRQVQAYAVNAADAPLMQACTAFALQIKALRSQRNDVTRAALETCSNGVAEIAALPVAQNDARGTAAERVREAVAKAALQRAA